MLLDLLVKAGLTLSEAQVYEALVLLGRAHPGQVSLYSNTTRENTYKILQQLEKRELAMRVADSKNLEYEAQNPKAVLEILESTQSDLVQTRELLTKAVHDFKVQLLSQKHKPVVQYFRGEEGLKTAYLLSAEEEDTLQYEIIHRRWSNSFEKWLSHTFIPLRMNRKIHKRIVFARTLQAQSLIRRNDKEMRETTSIDPQKFPPATGILAQYKKVVFVTDPEGKGEHGESVVIEQETIAAAMRAVVEMIWFKLTKK